MCRLCKYSTHLRLINNRTSYVNTGSVVNVERLAHVLFLTSSYHLLDHTCAQIRIKPSSSNLCATIERHIYHRNNKITRRFILLYCIDIVRLLFK